MVVFTFLITHVLFKIGVMKMPNWLNSEDILYSKQLHGIWKLGLIDRQNSFWRDLNDDLTSGVERGSIIGDVTSKQDIGFERPLSNLDYILPALVGG